ncbi:MAG: radical SAM protein [Chloroflexi bacterium]|nr:radical SAM protein [Chloroflexota bacterium]
MEFRPSLISWNLTERCNLACGHCYLDASPMPARAELSENECYRTVDEIAQLCPGAMLVLSGGEPLLRPDFLSIVRRAADRGLVTVVGTNGTLLTAELARRMAGYGVMGAGVSLDSATPRLHDRIRGMPGAWQLAASGIAAAQQAGLQVQVQATVMQANRAEVP